MIISLYKCKGNGRKKKNLRREGEVLIFSPSIFHSLPTFFLPDSYLPAPLIFFFLPSIFPSFLHFPHIPFQFQNCFLLPPTFSLDPSFFPPPLPSFLSQIIPYSYFLRKTWRNRKISRKWQKIEKEETYKDGLLFIK